MDMYRTLIAVKLSWSLSIGDGGSFFLLFLRYFALLFLFWCGRFIVTSKFASLSNNQHGYSYSVHSPTLLFPTITIITSFVSMSYLSPPSCPQLACIRHIHRSSRMVGDQQVVAFSPSLALRSFARRWTRHVIKLLGQLWTSPNSPCCR